MYNLLKGNEMMLLFPGSTGMRYREVDSAEDIWDFMLTVPSEIYTEISP